MNTSTFLSALCLGIASATISVAIHALSNEPILNWWFRIGEKYGKDTSSGREVEYWFYRPIWGCSKCFAGQISLWMYFFAHLGLQQGQGTDILELVAYPVILPSYSLFCHLFAISTAIITAIFFSYHINKIQND